MPIRDQLDAAIEPERWSAGIVSQAERDHLRFAHLDAFAAKKVLLPPEKQFANAVRTATAGRPPHRPIH